MAVAICPLCKDPVPDFDKPRQTHLCVAKLHDGKMHIHGDLHNKQAIKELIDETADELQIVPRGTLRAETVPAEVVFHNRQRIGDIFMFTCAVRDFKKAYPKTRVNVISTASHIWDHNPYIDRTLVATPENTVKIGPGRLTNSSNRLDWHFANAYRVSMEDALGISIPQGESRPDLWLTEEEYNSPRPWAQPYWVIVVGGEKGWGCKMYPFERWQAVVNQNPDLTFVQLGAAGDNHPRLQGPNVIDHIGKTEDRHTGIRDLYKIFLHAEGSIGLVSFHMHLSGGLYKPSVVVAGAREPVAFTRYQGHQYIANDGTLPCAATSACWHCGIDACTNLVIGTEKVPKCVDMIPPEEVTAAIRRYYVGGRLVMGKPSARPKLKNIVPTPVKVVVPEPPDVATKYGMEFGGGSLTARDWEFIQQVIKEHDVKTVLEFGAGLSSLLLGHAGLSVDTFETSQGWIDKITALKNGSAGLNVHLWDGKTEPSELKPAYDLAFVDGPAGGQNREEATRIASERARVVIVHDAGREFEKQWQAKHLEGRFKGPGKGGHRCHLWVRDYVGEARKKISEHLDIVLERAKTEFEEALLAGVDEQNRKKVIIASTARGWGGCARSVTTIMKLLVKQGHEVIFIPFRNAVTSREFKDCLNTELAGVKVENTYEALRQECDTLLVYADDFVWDFGQPAIAEVFTGLKASRKVMMVNYRRGGIGELRWTRDWDGYMFLNSAQERDLLAVHPGVPTLVLPPCTDLSQFFAVEPDYEGALRIVRHNSQGDTKFSKEAEMEITAALSARTDLQIRMMPGPSFVPASERFIKYGRNNPPIPAFLGLGNLFWYSLPQGYMDMGPRVILEAMAAGLPVVADNWGGAPDRVSPECGWICKSKSEQIAVIRGITTEDLRQKGMAARERAKKEFVPERWLSALLEEKPINVG